MDQPDKVANPARGQSYHNIIRMQRLHHVVRFNWSRRKRGWAKVYKSAPCAISTPCLFFSLLSAISACSWKATNTPKSYKQSLCSIISKNESEEYERQSNPHKLCNIKSQVPKSSRQYQYKKPQLGETQRSLSHSQHTQHKQLQGLLSIANLDLVIQRRLT